MNGLAQRRQINPYSYRGTAAANSNPWVPGYDTAGPAIAAGIPTRRWVGRPLANPPAIFLPFPGLTNRGMSGLGDAGWGAALVGIYQAYQQHAQQAAADDVAVDYLRDQVHLALADIRFAIRHGQVSSGQALNASNGVVAAFYAQTGAFPSATARQRAENYRAVFTANAALNGAEAEWFYGKWNCPDITTQQQIGEPRCVRLSVDATPGGTTPSGASANPPPVAGAGPGGDSSPSPLGGSSNAPGFASTGSILNVLGTIDLMGFSIPVLPVAVIAAVLIFKK